MEPNEYQKLAERTECNQIEAAHKTYINRKMFTRLNHAVLGLAGEVGELANALEKWIHYNQDFDLVNIIEELGDCLWYIALACNALNIPLEGVMQANIDKLKARYPERYSDVLAKEENRQRDIEREVLRAQSGNTKNRLGNHRMAKIAPRSTLEDQYLITIDRRDIPPPTDSYQRICTLCFLKRIHNNNKTEICPDCAQDERALGNKS